MSVPLASSPARTLRIGTRGSALALAQASLVQAALVDAGAAAVLETITTAGDRRAPDTAWSEGAFVTAIENALLSGDVDVAVHSAKDIPTDENPQLLIAAYLPRAAPGDVIVLRPGNGVSSLADLPPGTRVGTDSPRRRAFLLASRPDLGVRPLHGNVDTRLRRLDAGEVDAVVLAEAGLARLGRTDRISLRLDPVDLPPAPGQGAIAVQIRADDDVALRLVGVLDDQPTRLAVEAERGLLAASGGGCRAPLGALGRVVDSRLEVTAGYARPDGLVRVTTTRSGVPGDHRVIDQLLDDLARTASLAARQIGAPPVIVTRAAAQAAPLLLALVDRGFAPLTVPAIEVAPAVGGAFEDAIARLDTFDWVVVTSANTVRSLRAAAERAGRMLGTRGDGLPRWAVVGATTERLLHAGGVTVSLRPRRSSDAGLAEELPVHRGARVLVPGSDLADPSLVDRLAARGALVESVVAYRTIEAPAGSRELLADALLEAPVAVILTSPSTARGLLTLARDEAMASVVRELGAICIGATTAAEARRLGFRSLAEATSQAVAGIADATAAALLPQHELIP